MDEECLLHIGHSGRHFTGGPKNSGKDKNRKEKEVRASVNNYQEM